MGERARLFFALWPDESVRNALRRALPSVGLGGRVIPPENWHATLAFLGGVEPERLQALRALAGAMRGEAFTVVLDRIEEWNRSLVALVPTHPPCALLQLANELAARLAHAGFPTESCPYRVHVTLIRERRRGSGRREGLLATADSPPVWVVEWQVSDFALVQSHPGATGSRYEVVDRWPLGPG